MSIKLNHADARDIKTSCDLIFTDPPFDMHGGEVNKILRGISCNHLFLICTMRQLIELMQESTITDNKEWSYSFSTVLDLSTPRNKPKNIRQIHYTHANGIYLMRKGEKSRFNRRLRERSDAFDNNGYWSSVIRANSTGRQNHGMAKNQQAITDILGSFEISSVYDPFAGSGTTGFAAYELGLDCELTECNDDFFKQLQKTFRFLL